MNLSDYMFSKPVDAQNELCWNVFVRDVNSSEIVVRNIFHYNWIVTNDIIKIYKEHKKNPMTPNEFEERVKRALQHEYWARCEYETVITSWPPYVENAEIDRLNKERVEHLKECGKFYRTNVNLSVGEKIDVYTQIRLNWKQFIDYLWNNIDLIKKLKEVK